MELANVLTGIVALALSVLLSIVLVFVTFRAHTAVTKRVREMDLLLEGNRSIAIVLGAFILSQALLLRHAVYPAMVLVRNSIMSGVSFGTVLRISLYCVMYVVTIGALTVFLVMFAAWLFSKMTRRIDEASEIVKGNVAVAVLFAAVVLSIALIMESGVSDLAQSLIPSVNMGVIRLK